MADTQEAPAIDATNATTVANYIADILENEEKELDTSEKGREETENLEGQSEEETEETQENEGQEEGEELEENKETEDPVYTIKIDGEEIEVPLSELKKGYSRQSDYTRKTQELSQHQKALLSERAATLGTLQAAQRMIANDPLLAQEHEIDWATLAETDPTRYAQAKQHIETKKAQLHQIQEQTQIFAEQKRVQAFQQAEAKLLEIMPELHDKAEADKFIQDTKRIAEKHGIGMDDLRMMADHRFYSMIKDLREYEKLKAQLQSVEKKKVSAQPGKVQRPGNGQINNRNDKQLRNLKEKAKSGSKQDFDRLLDAVLE